MLRYALHLLEKSMPARGVVKCLDICDTFANHLIIIRYDTLDDGNTNSKVSYTACFSLVTVFP